MPKKVTTQRRHEFIWNKVYKLAELYKRQGLWPSTKPAILKVAQELQMSPFTVEDIYYGRH